MVKIKAWSKYKGNKPPKCNISDIEMKLLRCDIKKNKKDSPLVEHIPSIHEGKKHFICTICNQNDKKYKLK